MVDFTAAVPSQSGAGRGHGLTTPHQKKKARPAHAESLSALVMSRPHPDRRRHCRCLLSARDQQHPDKRQARMLCEAEY